MHISVRSVMEFLQRWIIRICNWIFGQISTNLNEIIVFCKYHKLHTASLLLQNVVCTRVLNKCKGHLLDNEEKYSCTYTFCHLINKKIRPISFFLPSKFQKSSNLYVYLQLNILWNSRVHSNCASKYSVDNRPG